MCTHVCVQVSGGSPELEQQEGEMLKVDAGNPTPVFWKIRKYSQQLSHLSLPWDFILYRAFISILKFT